MIKIGQSIHPTWVNGDLSKLGEELRQFKEAGADCCELVLHGLDVVIGTRIIDSRQEAVIKVLREYDMEYTLHMPHGLNLLDSDNQAEYLDIFRSSIEFARAAGIKLINYHAGMRRTDDKKSPGDKKKTDAQTKQNPKVLIQNEMEQIKSLAKDAPDILFCIENALFGKSPEVISVANNTASIIEFCQQVGLPNFKLTFDIGHSFLFNSGEKTALLEDMERLLPYIGHIHLHDNCGTWKEMRFGDGGHRLVLGAGDIHLPLGWGKLPFNDTLALLKDYSGIINLEIEQRFSSHYGECIAVVRGHFG